MSTNTVDRGVSAAALRIGILLVGVAIMAVPLWEGVTVGALVLLWPAVLAAMYAPASPAPAGVVIAAGLLVAIPDGDPLRVGVLVLVPLVHLFHLTCGIAALLPTGSRVHLSALRAPLRRFLTVQAVMAVVVVVAAVVPVGRTAPLLEVGGLAGLVMIALLVLWRQRVK